MLSTNLALEKHVLDADRLTLVGNVQVQQLGAACAGFFLLMATQQSVLFQQFETIRSAVRQISQPVLGISPQAVAVPTFRHAQARPDRVPTPAASELQGGIIWPTDVSIAMVSQRSEEVLSQGFASLGFPLAPLDSVWIDGFREVFNLFDGLHRSFGGIDGNRSFDPATTVSETDCIGAEALNGLDRRAGAGLPPEDARFDPAELTFAETLVQMLLLVVRAGKDGMDRFERLTPALTASEPFNKFGTRKLNEFIGRQKFIIDREPDRALATLPDRLVSPSQRRQALDVVRRIAGFMLEGSEPGMADVWDKLSSLLTTSPARSAVEITTRHCENQPMTRIAD
jgi:hypothetical protein